MNSLRVKQAKDIHITNVYLKKPVATFARVSTQQGISSNELTQLDQIASVQQIINKLDTRKIMVHEPQDLLEMSVEEFDKYFIGEVQKLLDIWTKRTRSTAIRAKDKPSLLRYLTNNKKYEPSK